MKQPELGKKIAQLRNEKGFTQEELVEQCNISVRTIQRIEAGEVTPRSYTLRIIMDALGADSGEFNDSKQVSPTWHKHMQWAWICGIVYFLLAIPEGMLDFGRWFDYSRWFDFNGTLTIDELSFATIGYTVLKLLILGSFFFFIRGFVRLGEYVHDNLLRITAWLYFGLILCIVLLDISSLFIDFLADGAFLFPLSFSFGILGILFGVALIRQYSQLGVIPVLAGVMEIVAGAFFLFFNPIGFLFLPLAELFEIITLYQAQHAPEDNRARNIAPTVSPLSEA